MLKGLLLDALSHLRRRPPDADAAPAELMAGCNRLTHCRYGWMLSNGNDLYIGRSLQHYGEYCQDEADVLQPYLSPGDWVVDAGANVGSMSLFFARAVGPTGRVYALEPQRIIHQMLCANAALNGLTQVRALHAAAGAHSGSIKVELPDYSRPNNFGAMQLDRQSQAMWEEGSEGEDVRLLRLDELDLERCRLIKIDVEGMEHAVLAGASACIARHRPLLYVENDREDRAQALLRQVAAMDYRIYRHVSRYFNPGNFLGRRDNIFEGICASNMLCLPAEGRHAAPALEEVRIPA